MACLFTRSIEAILGFKICRAFHWLKLSNSCGFNSCCFNHSLKRRNFDSVNDGLHDRFDAWLGHSSNKWLSGGHDGRRRCGSHNDWLGLTLRALVFVLALILALGLGSGNRHFTAHEVLVMKDFHCADGLIHAEHFHEAVALGAVRAAVVNNFNIPNCTDALEKLLQVLLGHVIGKISNINARGLHALRVSTSWAVAAAGRIPCTRLACGALAFLTLFTRLPWLARLPSFTLARSGVAGVGLGLARIRAGGRRARIWRALGPHWGGGCFIKTDGLQDFLPQAELGRRINAGRAGGLRAEFLDARGITTFALGWATVSAALATTLAAASIVALVLITV